jgi:hypothetical protein
MNKEKEYSIRYFFYLDIIAFGILILITILLYSSHYQYVDEVVYKENIPLLHKYGWSDKFLWEYIGPPGPTYAFLHALFEPITHLIPTRMRMVNMAMFGVLLYSLTAFFRQTNTPHHKESAFSILSAPITFMVACLAITEIPALTFLLLGYQMLLLALKNVHFWQKYALAIFSGILISLAIMGRQTYLVSLLTLPILYLQEKKKSDIAVIALCLIFSLLFPLKVFSVWQNLVPYQCLAANQEYVFAHGILGLGYSAIFVLCWNIDFFAKISRNHLPYFLGGIIFVFVINHFLGLVEFLPAKILTERFFSPALQPTIAKMFGSLCILLSLYFLYSLFIKTLENRKNVYYLFALANYFVILATFFKISHMFGARYVFQAFPFLMYLVLQDKKFHAKNLVLKIVFLLLGILFLWKYATDIFVA